MATSVLMISNLRFSLKLRKTGHRLEECFGGRFPAGGASSERADINLPIYVSGEVETPCLFGLFKPAIYITPEGALEKIFSLSEVSLDINVNGKSYNSYKVGKEVLERYKILIGQYEWDNVRSIGHDKIGTALTLSAGERKQECLSFYEKGGVTMITYSGREIRKSCIR